MNELTSTLIAIVSTAFMFGVPMGIGALTVVLSPDKMAVRYWYQAFAPWFPIILFLGLALLLAFEGAICIIMAAPIFLLFSSIGGLLIGIAKRREIKNTINVSTAFLIPFLILPVENALDYKPATYEALTSIKIHAPAERIWDNVVRVREISVNEDNGKLSKVMRFPRPIKAELDTLGVGGKRKAIFDKGLVFDETVYTYEHQKKMSFSIVPLTVEIPPQTMDEHIIVGGEYFTVLDGTYEMIPLGDNNYNLVLYSHFRMNTSFNFYSGYWARLIMKDIQNNILGIIKRRCEGN